MMEFLLFLSLLAFPALQDAPSAIVPELRLVEEKGCHSFVVKGATALPDGTILEVDLNARLTEEQSGEEVIKWMYSETAIVSGGGIEISFGNSPYPPYSLQYEAIVRMIRADQTEEVAAKLGAMGDIEVICARGAFDRGKFREEIQRLRDDLYRDFVTLNELYRELKGRLTELLKTKRSEEEAWQIWRKGFFERVGGLVERNDGRSGLWVVKTESRGKLYIGGMCQRLKDMVKACEAILAGVEKTETLRQMMGDFETVYSDYYAQLDFIEQIDKGKIAPHLKELREISRGIDDALRRIDEALTREEWIALRDEMTGRMTETVFELTALMPESTFRKIADVADRFARLLELCDRRIGGERGKPQDTAELRTAFDRAIADLERTVERSREKENDPPDQR